MAYNILFPLLCLEAALIFIFLQQSLHRNGKDKDLL